MKQLLRFILGYSLLILAACTSAPNISIDYDTSHSFAAIKTFHLITKKRAVNDLTSNRIINAITDHMVMRGITPTSADKADILIDFIVVTQDKTRVTSYNTGYAYRGGYRGGYGIGYGGNDVHIRQYTEGSLLIDLIDPKQRKTLWRGTGTATLKERTPDEKTELINRYTEAIIAEMPL